MLHRHFQIYPLKILFHHDHLHKLTNSNYDIAQGNTPDTPLSCPPKRGAVIDDEEGSSS